MYTWIKKGCIQLIKISIANAVLLNLLCITESWKIICITVSKKMCHKWDLGYSSQYFLLLKSPTSQSPVVSCVSSRDSDEISIMSHSVLRFIKCVIKNRTLLSWMLRTNTSLNYERVISEHTVLLVMKWVTAGQETREKKNLCLDKLYLDLSLAISIAFR